MKIKRPRVAAIGLDSAQVESIGPLCGELRKADSLTEYLLNYSWTETDIVVSGAFSGDRVVGGVHLLTIGPIHFVCRQYDSVGHIWRKGSVVVTPDNTEREVRVPSACPAVYKPLADDLSRQLGRAEDPPPVAKPWWHSDEGLAALVETTSGLPVACRLVLEPRPGTEGGGGTSSIALLLPKVADLSPWFGAFLSDVHETDPVRVPQSPPRLKNPSDWYTPEERKLAKRIAAVADEIERLEEEREHLETKLAAEGETADAGKRQALWAHGDNLVEAVNEILTDLAFRVQDMDVGLKQGEPKREDLRLTLGDRPDWEAIVEVDGYTSGTRTNDSRQLREHRDRYVSDKGQVPELTLWIANPYRAMDPSSRPDPDGNVGNAAANIGAVYVLASDLYLQWAHVATGELEASEVVQRLVSADPGLWSPPAPDSGT